MKAVKKWKRIASMPDSRTKFLKVWNFAGKCLPYGDLWNLAMREATRLYNVRYWKCQDESKQNG